MNRLNVHSVSVVLSWVRSKWTITAQKVIGKAWPFVPAGTILALASMTQDLSSQVHQTRMLSGNYRISRAGTQRVYQTELL